MPWQTADHHTVIAFRDRCTLWHILAHATTEEIPEQHCDLVRAAQIDLAGFTDLILQPRQPAREHHSVAETLLDTSENTLALDILALPIRCREIRVDLLAFLLAERDAGLVLFPAALIVSERQTHHRAAPLRVQIIRIGLHRLGKALLRLLAATKVVHDQSLDVVRLLDCT